MRCPSKKCANSPLATTQTTESKAFLGALYTSAVKLFFSYIYATTRGILWQIAVLYGNLAEPILTRQNGSYMHGRTTIRAPKTASPPVKTVLAGISVTVTHTIVTVSPSVRQQNVTAAPPLANRRRTRSTDPVLRPAKSAFGRSRIPFSALQCHPLASCANPQYIVGLDSHLGMAQRTAAPKAFLIYGTGIKNHRNRNRINTIYFINIR
jgi:hypothetical protein